MPSHDMPHLDGLGRFRFTKLTKLVRPIMKLAQPAAGILGKGAGILPALGPMGWSVIGATAVAGGAAALIARHRRKKQAARRARSIEMAPPPEAGTAPATQWYGGPASPEWMPTMDPASETQGPVDQPPTFAVVVPPEAPSGGGLVPIDLAPSPGASPWPSPSEEAAEAQAWMPASPDDGMPIQDAEAMAPGPVGFEGMGPPTTAGAGRPPVWLLLLGIAAVVAVGHHASTPSRRRRSRRQ